MAYLTALDLIEQTQKIVKSRGLELECVEISFRLTMTREPCRIKFSIKKKEKPNGLRTHDLIIWNKKTITYPDVSCPRCGGIVITGCSGFCKKCYIETTDREERVG